jgi:ribosome biogenesis GTPase
METLDPTLSQLGWSPFFSKQVSAEEAHFSEPVRVMSVHRGMVAVLGAEREDSISSILTTPRGPEDRPTVGDWLMVDRNSRAPLRILERKSLFRRPPPRRPRVQLIAANVDTLFVVTSCNQDFNVARIERYLVLAGEVGVRPVVVLTKVTLRPPRSLSLELRGRFSRGCWSS